MAAGDVNLIEKPVNEESLLTRLRRESLLTTLRQVVAGEDPD